MAIARGRKTLCGGAQPGSERVDYRVDARGGASRSGRPGAVQGSVPSLTFLVRSSTSPHAAQDPVRPVSHAPWPALSCRVRTACSLPHRLSLVCRCRAPPPFPCAAQPWTSTVPVGRPPGISWLPVTPGEASPSRPVTLGAASPSRPVRPAQCLHAQSVCECHTCATHSRGEGQAAVEPMVAQEREWGFSAPCRGVGEPALRSWD